MIGGDDCFFFLNDFFVTRNVQRLDCAIFGEFIGHDVRTILFYNNKTRLINIGDNLRKIFGYVYSNPWIKFEF